MLSKKAIELLQAVFAENSNIQVPIAVANEIIEIRVWISEQLVMVGISKNDSQS